MELVVVTGAGGYLGDEVLRCVRASGKNAIGLSRQPRAGLELCDMLDYEQLARFMDEAKPSVVIHSAWETPKTSAGYGDKLSSARGLAMVDNLLAATDASVIYISSMAVYGDGEAHVPRSEDDAGRPQSSYGIAKWEGERKFACAHRSGFAVRLPGLFGGSRCGGLVRGAMEALGRGELPTLPPGPLLWAAMHVSDAAEQVARLCARSPGPGFAPVNVGYEGTFSVSYFVQILEELYAKPIPYDIVHPKFSFDLRRARELGLVPRRDFKQALEQLKQELE
ncbi:NAD-dependent epimerase/dehydratase family protein [Bordetella genomosp. 13]|uniref:dTDP-4-dehydrorhamnose reductase n=1 Tax=Bordetella genomosp. 13 TaxID=463040 RepID=A0A1W6ZA01_9BORD|nr:NAD(P)-dependent oxidoreductase [Bordetella genomosp. 13]ARP94072.1 hypothetical protein CAL15_06550 [Bordetella genomosp. 13]